jgi:hypothetical protein
VQSSANADGGESGIRPPSRTALRRISSCQRAIHHSSHAIMRERMWMAGCLGRVSQLPHQRGLANLGRACPNRPGMMVYRLLHGLRTATARARASGIKSIASVNTFACPRKLSPPSDFRCSETPENPLLHLIVTALGSPGSGAQESRRPGFRSGLGLMLKRTEPARSMDSTPSSNVGGGI